MDTYDFEGIARGEAWPIRFTRQYRDGTPVDLGNRAVTFVIRDNNGQRAKIVRTGDSIGGTMTVTPAEGTIEITVTPDVTAAVKSGRWGLWLDEYEPTADAVAAGAWRTTDVPRSDV